MTSQLGKQTIAIHIALIISLNKGSQTMKFSPNLEQNKRNFFFIGHVENAAGRLFRDFFLSFRNTAYEVKTSGLQLNSIIF